MTEPDVSAGRRQPRWVVAFLRGLERHGVARQAAFEAGVDYTTAYERRKRHPHFGEEWRRAADTGKAARLEEEASRSQAILDGVVTCRPGEEQVRPGSASAQLVKASPERWSMRREAAFLAELAASANVRRAAAAAGISTAAIYQRRLKHPGFAGAWDEAILVGRARLEALLIEAAERQFDPVLADLEGDVPPVSTSEAIRLLSLTRPRPGPKVAAPPEPEEPVDDEMIIARIEEGLKRYAPPKGTRGNVHELVVVIEEERAELAAATVPLCCPHCDGIVPVRFDESSMAWHEL